LGFLKRKGGIYEKIHQQTKEIVLAEVLEKDTQLTTKECAIVNQLTSR
jgi:hypothetical protein